jgi:hypothetical protein
MTTTRKERKLGTPSRSVLRLIPERVVVFLHGVATHPEIGAALSACGYSKHEHAEGAQLLSDACSIDLHHEEFAAHARRIAAQRELGEWAARHLTRLQGAIAHVHPEHIGLFDGILPLAPNGSVKAIRRLIQRLRALPAEAPGPRALIAARRVDDSEIDRLSALVEIAREAPTRSSKEAQRHYEARLHALYMWHTEWSHAARALIRRRDWLIQLGLAARARRRDETFTGESVE